MLYDARSPHRELESYWISFETNDTGTPDGLSDPEGLVSTVARSAQGRFLITLSAARNALWAQAHMEETDTYTAQVSARSASAGTIQVSVLSNLGAEVDTTDKTIVVRIDSHK